MHVHRCLDIIVHCWKDPIKVCVYVCSYILIVNVSSPIAKVAVLDPVKQEIAKW